MTVGLQLRAEDGHITLRATDRMTRYYATYRVTIPPRNSSIILSIPEMTTDGTWTYYMSSPYYLGISGGISTDDSGYDESQGVGSNIVNGGIYLENQWLSTSLIIDVIVFRI